MSIARRSASGINQTMWDHVSICVYCNNSLLVVRTSSPPPPAVYRDWSPIWSDYHSLASHHQIKTAKAAWFDCFAIWNKTNSMRQDFALNCLLIKGVDEWKSARFVLNDMGGKVLMVASLARFILSTCIRLSSTAVLLYSLPFLKIAAFAHSKPWCSSRGENLHSGVWQWRLAYKLLTWNCLPFHLRALWKSHSQASLANSPMRVCPKMWNSKVEKQRKGRKKVKTERLFESKEKEKKFTWK